MSMRLALAHFAALLAAALSAEPAAAGEEGTDMRLEDMGFIMRAATTPAQMERLRLLPPRKFVRRTKEDRRYYLYADPDFCQCVFVGNELAMRNYQVLVSPPSAPPMPTGPGRRSHRGAAGSGTRSFHQCNDRQRRYSRLLRLVAGGPFDSDGVG
jgi:hypothetical protein